jgi:hypothetical protein
LERHTADAEVSDCVVGDEVDDLIKLALLGGILGVKLPEAVEPPTLERLLRCEESTNEAGTLSAA